MVVTFTLGFLLIFFPPSKRERGWRREKNKERFFVDNLIVGGEGIQTLNVFIVNIRKYQFSYKALGKKKKKNEGHN